jgi:hypothetical protein
MLPGNVKCGSRAQEHSEEEEREGGGEGGGGSVLVDLSCCGGQLHHALLINYSPSWPGKKKEKRAKPLHITLARNHQGVVCCVLSAGVGAQCTSERRINPCC